MKLFVINLARRTDRRAAMARQLNRLGLSFEAISAVDAEYVNESWLARYFTPSGPLGSLPKGDRCCSLSHRKAWQAFLASDEDFAVILEDDIILDASASKLLNDPSWLPEGVDLMKLEHFGPESQRILVGPRQKIGRAHSVAPILSRHTGAAAYIISRSAAEQLLALERWNVPVDHLLFNANVSPQAAALKPYQLLPAIARQESSFTSDIRQWRVVQNKFSLSLAKREIVRAYYELRLLPKQIAAVLTGHARLAKVANASLRAPAFYPEAPVLLHQRSAARNQA